MFETALVNSIRVAAYLLPIYMVGSKLLEAQSNRMVGSIFVTALCAVASLAMMLRTDPFLIEHVSDSKLAAVLLLGVSVISVSIYEDLLPSMGTRISSMFGSWQSTTDDLFVSRKLSVLVSQMVVDILAVAVMCFSVLTYLSWPGVLLAVESVAKRSAAVALSAQGAASEAEARKLGRYVAAGISKANELVGHLERSRRRCTTDGCDAVFAERIERVHAELGTFGLTAKVGTQLIPAESGSRITDPIVAEALHNKIEDLVRMFKRGKPLVADQHGITPPLAKVFDTEEAAAQVKTRSESSLQDLANELQAMAKDPSRLLRILLRDFGWTVTLALEAAAIAAAFGAGLGVAGQRKGTQS